MTQEKSRFLWSTDANGLRFNPRANIIVAEVLPETDEDQSWTVGEFGDGWIRLVNKPEIDSNGQTLLDSVNGKEILCSVRDAGNGFWYATPIEPVYTTVKKEWLDKQR